MKAKLKQLINPGMFILAFLLLSAFPRPESQQQTWKVKSMTIQVTEKKKGAMITYKDEYIEYNKAGKELLRINYRSDGSIREKESNVYDTYGNRVERKTFEDLKERKAEVVQEHKTFIYNAYREKTEEREYSPDAQLIARSVFSYNTDGKRSSESIFNKEGSLKKKHIYIYNTRKLLELRSTLSPSGDTLENRKYSYQYF
jgi:hypothetical protein